MTLHGSASAEAPKPLFGPGDFPRPFLVLWAIFSIFYFSELANFSLSIDEEFAALRPDRLIWVAQERWLAYLIERFVLPPPVIPFFPLFLFGALASLGYMIVVRAHRYRLEDWPVTLAFLLFGAFPILYFILDFAFVTVSFGVALLLSCLCLHLFDRALDSLFEASPAPAARRRAIGLLVLQVLAGAAAIGVYQSLILLVAAGCGGMFLLRHLSDPALKLRQILIVHACLAGALAGSVILSFLVSRGFQWVLDVRPSYTGGFIHLDRLADSPLAVLRNLIREYWAVYGGKRAVYGFRYVTIPALLVLGIGALAAQAARRGNAAIAFAVLYSLVVTLLPFAINPVSAGWLPYRALVAVPYVVWFFAAGALASPLPVVRRIAIALLIIVSVQCLHTFSTFQAQKRLVLDRDKLLASEIYQRVVGEIPDFDRSKTYRIDFYGAYEFRGPSRQIAGSTLSASFFAWDGGNPSRIIAFMKLLGYANFRSLNGAERRAVLPILQEMPLWPAAGSVRAVDGAILVRLGREPGVFHRALTAADQP